MFKTKSRTIPDILHSLLTGYMGRTGLILYAKDDDGGIDLNSAAVKAAIQAAVDEAIAPLAAKRDELLAENRKLKQGKQVSPEDYAALESERDDLKSQLDKAGKDLKAANATAEKATKALADEQGFTQKLLIDNGLLETLSKNGVTDPAYQKAAVAMLRSGVQIVAEGDQRIAKVGDKALADHVAEWAKSDEGKRFASAPGNTGGGSQGGSGQGGGKTMARSAFEALAPEAKAAAIKDGTKLTD